MYGISWSAFNALMTAQRKPPALKAIIAAHGSTDLYYNDVHYIDGALHIDSYAHQIDTDNALPRSPDYAVDEAYFSQRFDREPWIFTWLRQQQDGDFWRRESVRLKPPLEVPAYVIGGLLDGYRDFVLDVVQTAKAPVIADIGPWNHAWPEYGKPGPNYEWRQKAVRWWDHWLKGVDTGMLNEPRWTAFMRTGHGADPQQDTPGHWRCDAQWPIAGSSTQQWYPQAAQQLGLPEARIPLANAVIELCLSPKSNSAMTAIDAALADIRQSNVGQIPDQLKDAHYKGASKLGHGTGYLYPHDYPGDWVAQAYLPDRMQGKQYFAPKGESKFEAAFKSQYQRLHDLQKAGLKGK